MFDNIFGLGQALSDALEQKKQLAAERSLNSTYTADVYDELLTAAEIQRNVDAVNHFGALENVALAMEKADAAQLMVSLFFTPVAFSRIGESHLQQKNYVWCNLLK